MSTNCFYGAEQVLFEYLKNNNGHRFFIYTSDVIKNAIDSISDIEGVTVVSSSAMRMRSIRRKPMISLFYILRNLFAIHKLVKRNHIDVIYGNNTVDMVYVMLYRYFFRCSIGTICHIHDIIQRSMYHKMLRRFGKYIDAFITPSLAGKNSFIDDIDSSDNIHVVYNGCSILRQRNVRRLEENKAHNKKKMLLFVGLISELKRVDLFIKIVEKLNKDYPDLYQGVVVGGMNANDSNYISAFESSLKDSEIRYLGYIKHEQLRSEIFPQVDALVLTSNRDTLPTVILEAMASNVLVCARTVDGVPEMIQDGINGVLWDYDASVDMIANIVHVTLRDEGKVTALKENALKTIKEKFNPEKKKNLVNALIDGIST